jgi:hypothetical protein
MDVRKFKVNPEGRLHLRNAEDDLMYADEEKKLPMAVILFGPGSKQHANATTKQSNAFLAKLRKKGKVEQSTEDRLAEQANFLSDCTSGWENVEYGDATGRDLSLAIYSDPEVGFIADQVAAYLKEWANFSTASPTS